MTGVAYSYDIANVSKIILSIYNLWWIELLVLCA